MVRAFVEVTLNFTRYLHPFSSVNPVWLSWTSQSFSPGFFTWNTIPPSVTTVVAVWSAFVLMPHPFVPSEKSPLVSRFFPVSSGLISGASIFSSTMSSIQILCCCVICFPPTAPMAILKIVSGSVSSFIWNSFMIVWYSPVRSTVSWQYGVQSSFPSASLWVLPSLCNA